MLLAEIDGEVGSTLWFLFVILGCVAFLIIIARGRL